MGILNCTLRDYKFFLLNSVIKNVYLLIQDIVVSRPINTSLDGQPNSLTPRRIAEILDDCGAWEESSTRTEARGFILKPTTNRQTQGNSTIMI